MPKRPPAQRRHSIANTDGSRAAVERIWQAVHAIPLGRVSTYGWIAEVAGLPKRARLVGRTLSQLPNGTRLPWHRVVNAAGQLSVRGGGEKVQEQRLRREGVQFAGTRINLGRFGWPNEARATRPLPRRKPATKSADARAKPR